MNLPDKFKFEVVGGVFPVYFANKLNSTVYEISWEENDQVKSCTYTVPSVESEIKTGGWKIIKEGENMKLKPFNLEKALAGEKVVTRDGRNVVEIVKLSKAVGSQSVIAVKEDGSWASYTSDGYSWAEGSLSDNDLFMAPTKKQGWVNIYKQVGNTYVATVYLSEEEALQNRCIISLVDTVMIEWEE